MEGCWDSDVEPVDVWERVMLVVGLMDSSPDAVPLKGCEPEAVLQTVREEVFVATPVTTVGVEVGETLRVFVATPVITVRVLVTERVLVGETLVVLVALPVITVRVAVGQKETLGEVVARTVITVRVAFSEVVTETEAEDVCACTWGASKRAKKRLAAEERPIGPPGGTVEGHPPAPARSTLLHRAAAGTRPLPRSTREASSAVFEVPTKAALLLETSMGASRGCGALRCGSAKAASSSSCKHTSIAIGDRVGKIEAPEETRIRWEESTDAKMPASTPFFGPMRCPSREKVKWGGKGRR